MLRGALIGCGFFGQIQLEAWRRMPEVEIVAACDVDAAKAQASAARAYDSVEAMFAAEPSLDFVGIATRPDTHLALVQASIERNIPAICQKPMAPSLAEAQEMARLVRKSGVPVMIHENWRWQPWYREAKRRIDAGEIGAPVTYHFRHRQGDGLGPEPFRNQPYFREMPRLLIYETLVHYLDTARFLFGEIEGVAANTHRHNPLIRGEDGATILVEHDEVVGTISGNRYLNPEQSGPAMGEAWLEGDEALLRIEANGDMFLAGERVWQTDTSVGYKGDSARATQQHFIECLQTGRPFESSVDEYLITFASVEAAYRSAAEKRQIRVAEVLGL